MMAGALEVGKIFYADKNVVPYNNLGIGRLIYQLPIPLCEMFMTEVFGENLPDTFDEETLTTINKFFENNLNVSETVFTSKELIAHWKAPGEKKEVSFQLSKEEMNFVQIPGKPEVICHDYELMLEDGAEKWWSGNVTEM